MVWQMTAHPDTRLATAEGRGGGGPSLGTCSCPVRPRVCRVAEQADENLLYFQQ